MRSFISLSLVALFVFTTVVCNPIVLSPVSIPEFPAIGRSDKTLPSFKGFVNNTVPSCTLAGIGDGRFLQLRMSNCVGRCIIQPGRIYNAEIDFMVGADANSNAFLMTVDVVFGGVFVRLIAIPLITGPVRPGVIYTIRQDFRINDVFEKTFTFKTSIYRKQDEMIETCFEVEMDIA